MIPQSHWNLPKHITTFNHIHAVRHSSFFITLSLTDRGFSYAELIPCLVGATKQIPHRSQGLWEPAFPHLPHKHTFLMSWTAAANVLEIHSAAGNNASLFRTLTERQICWKQRCLLSCTWRFLFVCMQSRHGNTPTLLWEHPGSLHRQYYHAKQKEEGIKPRKLLWNCHLTWDLANAKSSFWSKPRPLTVQKTRKGESLMCEL